MDYLELIKEFDSMSAIQQLAFFLHAAETAVRKRFFMPGVIVKKVAEIEELFGGSAGTATNTTKGKICHDAVMHLVSGNIVCKADGEDCCGIEGSCKD